MCDEYRRTAVIYINDNGIMQEDHKFFFRHEIDHGQAVIFEYATAAVEKELNEICEALWERFRYCEDWQLIIVDDRRREIKAGEVYGKKYFLWKLIDGLMGSDGTYLKEYHGVSPVNTFMVATLAGANGQRTGDDFATIEVQAASSNRIPAGIRFFLYFFGEDETALYERREFTFFLILLGMVMNGMKTENLMPFVVYGLSAEWDWNNTGKFIERMKFQYRQLEEQLHEDWIDIRQVKMEPVYADFAITPSVSAPVVSEAAGTLKTQLKSLRDKLEKSNQELQAAAAKGFEDIRVSEWGNDEYEWDKQKIETEKQKYEKGIILAYQCGAFDYTAAKERVRSLQKRLQQEQTAGRAGGRVLAEGMFCLIFCIWMCMKNELLLWVFLAMVCMLLMICLVRWSSIDSRPSVEIQEELMLMQEQIRADEDRINSEFKNMAEYRRIYRRYYAVYEWQKNAGNQNLEVTRKERLLCEQREFLRRLEKIARENIGVEGQEMYPWHSSDQEAFYYPQEWETYKVEASGNDRMPFPYPMIKNITAERLWGEKQSGVQS